MTNTPDTIDADTLEMLIDTGWAVCDRCDILCQHGTYTSITDDYGPGATFCDGCMSDLSEV